MIGRVFDHSESARNKVESQSKLTYLHLLQALRIVFKNRLEAESVDCLVRIYF